MSCCRVEDTDQARSTKESEAAVLRDLAWLGITYDEGTLPFGLLNANRMLCNTLDSYSWSSRQTSGLILLPWSPQMPAKLRTCCHNIQGLMLEASMDHTGSPSGKRSTRSMWIGEQTFELPCKQVASGARLPYAAVHLLQIIGSRTLPNEALGALCSHRLSLMGTAEHVTDAEL